MVLPDFLTLHPYNEISLTGHRIGLYTVMRCYKEGYTAERIVEEFPSLELEHVKKVIAFALENWEEVDAYVEAYRAELARQEALPPGPALLKLRQWMAMIEQADAERRGDPDWAALTAFEKLQRLRAEPAQDVG